MELRKIDPLPKEYLESIGFHWHTDSDGSSYVADELVVVSQKEASAYYEAANELYDMYVEAAQHVIEHNRFHEIGIPFNLVELIKRSWENDVHWHLYGRFDFAGGVDGKPIKLLEFNADTPTSLFETAVVQWALLKYNNLQEARQFNNLYEALKDNFKRLVTLFDDPDEFEKRYKGWKILFSAISGSLEDENTTKLLQAIANDAGFETAYASVEEVGFGDEGVFWEDRSYEFWFKLIPWEDIAIDEPELALLLDSIIKNQKAIILNPAYTLLFQSKGMLKILWELFEGHPLLLPTYDEPLHGSAHVEKKLFGREGANTKIVMANGEVLVSTDGPYENFASIYQAYTQLPIDERGYSYQAGVFFAYEACGLGFRRGSKILDNESKFVGHIITD